MEKLGTEVTRETRKLKKDRCPSDWHWDDRKKKCQPNLVPANPNGFFVCPFTPEGIALAKRIEGYEK